MIPGERLEPQRLQTDRLCFLREGGRGFTSPCLIPHPLAEKRSIDLMENPHELTRTWRTMVCTPMPEIFSMSL